MKVNKTLSEFLREKRLAANLSQAEVAQKFGFKSAQFISNWERGISSPPMSCVRKLIRFYRVSGEEVYAHFLSDMIFRETKKLKRAFGRGQ